MRPRSRVPAVLAAAILTSALAGCNAGSVRRPMSRSQRYRTTIADYKTATVLPSETDKSGTRTWSALLPAGSFIRATVSGQEHIGIITVKYPDEPVPRAVHPP